MSDDIVIAIDAMGGDNGPRIVFHGARLCLREHDNIRFVFHGPKDVLEPLLADFPELKPVSTIKHYDVVVAMDEKPSKALRTGRNVSSMWGTLQTVKDGEANVALSNGNTGALMAMSTFCLRPIEGVSRPAIAAIWPTTRADIIVLDVGATVGGDGQQLVDFAILGAALAQALFDKSRPTVGLLNVGTEELKGGEQVKDAARILTERTDLGFQYQGFVEGSDLGKGTVDVVVTEGFTGNVALKTAEGTARQVGTYLRKALKADIISRLGAIVAMRALTALKRRMDPRSINGGVFLGLNGVVIKSHGGTDEIGFKSALDLAYEMGRFDLIEKVNIGLKKYAPDKGSEIADPQSEETSASVGPQGQAEPAPEAAPAKKPAKSRTRKITAAKSKLASTADLAANSE